MLIYFNVQRMRIDVNIERMLTNVEKEKSILALAERIIIYVIEEKNTLT